MGQTQDNEQERLALQAHLDALKTQEERNRLGQFATPTELALQIVRYSRGLLGPRTKVRFLDPAIGTGSFFSALLSVFEKKRIIAAEGFEIDPHYAHPATDLWRGTSLSIHLADFTKQDPPNDDSQRFNLVVCNPPYVRHHHLHNGEKTRLQRIAEESCGARMSGLSGLYCYFICLCHTWMTARGIAAWLVPSEFMDVNYGAPIKNYFLHRVALLRIHRFDPREIQFGDAIVSSSVVWFRKAPPPSGHAVEFTFGGTVSHPKISRKIPADVLREERKWTRFPAVAGASAEKTSTLGDFFTIKRGLATGDNHFFILTRQQIRAQGLSMDFFRPVLPSPRYLDKDEILADHEGNPVIEPDVFLLDCRLPEHEVERRFPALWRYLQSGRETVAKGYLCSHRSPWYSQEDRPAAPIVCTYMGRQDTKTGRPFRFILNHSRATAANVYLLLYPKAPLARALAGDPGLIREVWGFLNSISPKTLMGEGRVYGGSLHKLEPRELANVSADELCKLLRNRVRHEDQLDLFKVPAK